MSDYFFKWKGLFFILVLSLFINCAKEKEGVEDVRPEENLKRTLVYGIPQDPVSLDPTEASDLIYVQIAFNIFESLLRYDWESEKYLPALATSWEKSADGVVWVFHLRPGVVFHDGSPLNAQAVKLSFDRQIDPGCPFYRKNITDTYGKLALDMIEKITIIDDLTVRFTLKYPCAFFMDNIATPCFASIVNPSALQKYRDQLGFHPVGTGPFKFREWKRGDRIILDKFEKYWGKSPRIERVIYKVLPDLREKIEALKKGELDVITGLSAASIHELYYTPKIKIFTPRVLGTVFLGFNCQRQPFDDLRIRKAISFALDVKSVVACLSRGFSDAAQGPLPPNVPGYDPSIKQAEYNLEKARKLMEQAGYPNGFQTKLCYFIQTDTLRANPLAQYIKSQLEQIGIRTQIVPYNDWSIYQKDVLEQGKTDMFLDGWSMSTRDADDLLYPLFHSQSRCNFFNYSNSKVDQLLEQARQTLDKGKRQRLYQDVQRIIVKETPAVFISHSRMGYAIRERVKNFKADPTMIVRLDELGLGEW